MQNAEAIIAHFISSSSFNETRLDLSNCSLSELPSSLNDPSIYERLELLNLANNNLQTLPSWLVNFSRLRILFLLDNSFSQVPPVISLLPAVYMLSFKKNNLAGIIHGSSMPKNITWLILTSNRITQLAADFPVACRRVRKLMLSNNLLDELPAGFDHHMTELELLRLSNNRFERFPRQIFALEKIAWFSIAGNPCCGGTVTSVVQLPSHLRIADLTAEYDIDSDGNDLGEGTSGSVVSATRKSDSKPVALKKFKELTGSDGKALDEISVTLSCAGISGVVTPCGYFYDNNSGELILITELVPDNPKTIAGPPSFDSCTRSVYPVDMPPLTREQADLIVKQISHAVEGLLKKGIAHGDVYGHNVLVGKHRKNVALGDLGAAWRFPEDFRVHIERIERRALQVFIAEIQSRVLQ